MWNQNLTAAFEFEDHQLLDDVVLLQDTHAIMRPRQQLHSENEIELIKSSNSRLFLELILNCLAGVASLLQYLRLFIYYDVLEDIETLVFSQIVLNLIYDRFVG